MRWGVRAILGTTASMALTVAAACVGDDPGANGGPSSDAAAASDGGRDAGGSDATDPGIGDAADACALDPSLIAWWRGDGNGKDALGSYPLSPQATVAYAPGKHGDGFSLNGAGHLESAVAFQTPTSMTIDGWIRVSADSRGTIIGTIGPSNLGFAVGFVHGSGNHHLELWAAAQLKGTSAAETVPIGVLLHFAVTASSSGLRFYVNGSGGPTLTGFQVPNENVPVTVGVRKTTGGGFADYFSGIIDELAVYNRVLSVAEIQALQAAGPSARCK